MQRITRSLEKFGDMKNFSKIASKWNSPPAILKNKHGMSRVKIIFSLIKDNWELTWDISDFIPEMRPPLKVGVHRLLSPRWATAPGMTKTGEGHEVLFPIYQEYLSRGYDEVIFVGKNGEWGDSFYSNLGLLLDQKLIFSPTSQFVQEGTGVLRLIQNPELSPWPVKFENMNWDEIQSKGNSVFILLNGLRGPRVIGKIEDRFYNINQELIDITAKFYQHWYQ